MMLHSLRPHTPEGHMAIYKYVLHHSSNTLQKWLLETLGVWVSTIKKCDYCVDHHFAVLLRLLEDDFKAGQIKEAIDANYLDKASLNAGQKCAMAYVQKLTQVPSDSTEKDIIAMRALGYSDGEILEINQVTAYFTYANRTVLGLGCNT